MESIELNKNSWHFWLAKAWGGFYYWEGDEDGYDICSYIRAVIKGIFKIVLAIVAASSWLMAYFYSGYVYFACLFDDACEKIPDFSGFFIGNNIVVGFLVFFAFACIGVDKYRDYRAEHPVPKKEPSFIGIAWKKFKTKTCFMVKFK